METGFTLAIICTIVTVAIVLFFAITVLMNKIKSRVRKPKTEGIIHVDYSDPIDGPHLFLELRVPVTDVISRKRVTLDVDTTQFYSHE